MNRYLINESQKNIEKYYNEKEYKDIVYYLMYRYPIGRLNASKLISFQYYNYYTKNTKSQFIDFCLYYNYLYKKHTRELYEVDYNKVFEQMDKVNYNIDSMFLTNKKQEVKNIKIMELFFVNIFFCLINEIQYLNEFVKFVSKKINKSEKPILIDSIYYITQNINETNKLKQLYNMYVKLIKHNKQTNDIKIDFDYEKETNILEAKFLS